MRTMKRKIPSTLLIAFLFVSACGLSSQEEEAPEKILEQKKEELRKLEKEVEELEEKIAASDTGEDGKDRKVLVETKRMKARRFEHFFKVNGSVIADHEVLLSPERQGKIEEILVEEGDQVEEGDLIAKQSQKVLRSQLREIRTRYQHARTLYEKQERLWKEKGVGSEMDYLNAKNEMESLRAQMNTLEEELEMTSIESPIDGTVEEVRLKKGAFASPSTPIARIIGLEDLSVEADLSESYLNKIHKGDPVWIGFPRLDSSFVLEVSSLGDRIHPENRTFKVRVDLQNTPERSIKPNLSATLRFRDLNADSAMVVPSGVIRSDRKGDFVYLVSPSDTAQKQYIELGPSQEGRSLVHTGLNSGDRVVVAGYDRLSKGMAIREEKNEKKGEDQARAQRISNDR